MLFTPFTFKNGITAKNRIFKSAMEEALAKDSRPTQDHATLYKRWAKGGAGVLVTGNVMVSTQGKGSSGDVVLQNADDLPILQAWATQGSQNNTLMIMQLNHAGKQATKDANPAPVAPSAIALQGMDAMINPPRALTGDEIRTIIGEFATSAKLAKDAGFHGVQIHAAHGYLVSQFLSPHHNVRDDDWGGSLDNRMRFLLEIYQSIREAVGNEFLVGVKLNSADFQKGGFDENDSLAVVQQLSKLGVDFIEISGGNYESPVMMSAKDSTKQREAFFIDYAKKARAVSDVPLIITGGFRSESAMNDALASGELDFVGIGRPLILMPDMPNQLQNGTYTPIDTPPIRTGVEIIDKNIGSVLELAWYMAQIKRLVAGLPADPTLDPMLIVNAMQGKGKETMTTGRV